MNLTSAILNTTTTISPPTPDTNSPLWIGYVAVVIAVVFFGSNLVPVGKYPIGDGLSFQFFMCCGVWIVGLIIDLFVKSPPFFPLVLIGGVLWTTGNIMSVFVVRINGLGMSMLLWSTTNMLIAMFSRMYFFSNKIFRLGWASGHFGWFGLIPENVQNPILNYIGVTIAGLSGIAFLAIRTVKEEKIIENIEEREPMILPSSTEITSEEILTETTITPVSSSQNVYLRLIGSIIATIAGVLFGFIFIPSTYIQDHPNLYPTSSKNGLHYVFSMYSGIFLSSMTYYLVYIIYKGNRPYLHVESILPGIISGVMWGIAQAGFLVANSVLSQTISFPLISIGPGTVAVMWSMWYFKDISGRQNYMIVGAGTLLRIISVVLIVLSKPISS